MTHCPPPIIQHLGLMDYSDCERAMQTAVAQRDSSSADEFWVLQHPAVITLGVSASASDVLPECDIPVVRSSRGGQTTCHAPGQLIVYTLLNLHRIGLGVRTLVACLEDAVISLLTERNVPAHRRDSLPGVYVRDNKIASIGLRINRGHSFHGLALNVAPDLRLFKKFCVCGNPSLTMTSLHECGVFDSVERTAQRLLPHLKRALYHDRAFT